MNALVAEKTSTPVYVDDLTVPKTENPMIGELTETRIESFFCYPTLTSEDDVFNQCESRSFNQPEQEFEMAPIAIVPNIDYRPISFESLSSWEGYVVEIFNDSFIARISDLRNENPDEEVEIIKKEIPKDDYHLIQPGAIFNWHIGYQTIHGTLQRVSVFRFRRMPKWNKADFKKSEGIKDKLKKLFGYHDATSGTSKTT